MDREEIYKKLAARRLAPTAPPFVATPLRRVGGADQLHHPPIPKKSSRALFLFGGLGLALAAAAVALWMFPFPPPEQEVRAAARSSFDAYIGGSAFGAKTSFVSLELQPTVRGKKTFLYVVRGHVQLTETIYHPVADSSTTLYALMAQRLAQVSREGLPAGENVPLPEVPALPAVYETSHYKGETAECQFQIQGTKSEGKWVFFDVPRSFACRRFKGSARGELPADAVVLGTSDGEAAIARYLKAGNAYLLAYLNAKRQLAGNSPAEAEHKPVAPPVPPIEGAVFTGQVSHRGEPPTSFRAVVGKFDPALGLMPVVFTVEGSALSTTCELRPSRTSAEGAIEATLVNKGTSGAIYGSAAARGVSRFFVRGTGASFDLSIEGDTIRVATLSAWTLSLTKAPPEDDSKGTVAGTDKAVVETTPRRAVPVALGPAITITFPKEKTAELRMSAHAEAAEKASADGRSNRAAPVTENLMPFAGGLN